MTYAWLRSLALSLTVVLFDPIVGLIEPCRSLASEVDVPDSTKPPAPRQGVTVAQDSITSIAHAIEIVHQAVNGHKIAVSEFDIDTFAIHTESGPLGREPFYDGSYGSLGVFIQKGYIYVATEFESGGDGWIEEYKCKLSALNEQSMTIWIDDQYYVLNSQPKCWYIRIEAVDSSKSIEFNLDGMVGSTEGPLVDYLTLAVKDVHDLVNTVEALKYLIRQARYGSPDTFDWGER